jgi:hypothetical protein
VAEAFREVGVPPIVPSFGICDGALDHWTNYNGLSNSTAAFFRDPFGVVHLKGTIRCAGTPIPPSIIFTLPSGYRPALQEYFSTPDTSNFISFGVVVLAVSANGNVTFASGNPGANGALELDGITFRCEPSGSDGCP